MSLNGRTRMREIHSGERIPAAWLNQIAKWIVRNVSVNGGRFQHRGGSLVLDLDRGQRGAVGASDFIIGKITAVTGTSHNAVYSVEALRRTVTLTSATPYIRPIDSGGVITEAAVDDWAMLARVEDSEGADEWILWQVPEVVTTRACIEGQGPQTVSSNYVVAATDTMILIDASGGNVQVTVPVAADHEAREIEIKRIDAHASNTATVVVSGGGTIDDATTVTLKRQYEAIRIKSDGSEWWAN